MERVYEIRRTLRVEFEGTPAPGIYVWRTTLSEEGCPDVVKEGVGPILPDPHNVIPRATSKDQPGTSWYMVDPKALHSLAMWGYSGSWREHISSEPYSKREGLILVRDYWYDHKVFKDGSDLCPAATLFDYSGGITTREYDLDEAISILKARADTADVRRIHIPYHNASEDEDEAVEFLWRPSAEDYVRYREITSWQRKRVALETIFGLSPKKTEDDE